jgi:hypothetical protein
LKEHRLRSYLPLLAVLALWAFALTSSTYAQPNATVEVAGRSSRTYLPLVLSISRSVTPSPFAIETTSELRNRKVQTHAASLGASWIRINLVSWRDVKPTEDATYNPNVLAYFEGQLLAAVRLGLTPVVVVDDSPRWATVGEYSCGAIREDRHANFGNFMNWLVHRYSKPPYNVHYWELGNEPDVDPEHSGLPTDNVFGCWGDIDDTEYFGGDDYGRMLNVVTPRIREADPNAKVLIGGLLLANPNSLASEGRPEYFLRGILSVPGAANNFDIVAYHAYTSWVGEPGEIDVDLANREWGSLGGLVVGKARFLREEMARYGVDKPLWLNEAGYMCHAYYVALAGLDCRAAPDHYWQLQADHLVRMGVRTVNAGVAQFSWYTLNGPGWNQAGLLDNDQTPRPSYTAYKQLVTRTLGSNLPPVLVPYGGEVEAYRFTFPQTTRVVDVAWSRDATPDLITVPQDRFVAAYSRDGALITPEFADGTARFNVGFSPIYIHRQP